MGWRRFRETPRLRAMPDESMEETLWRFTAPSDWDVAPASHRGIFFSRDAPFKKYRYRLHRFCHTMVGRQRFVEPGGLIHAYMN